MGNGRIGLCNNPVSIRYNISQLDKLGRETHFEEKLANYNAASEIGYAGRYMVCLEASLDTRTINMSFIDLQKDDNEAIKISDSLKTEQATLDFLSMYAQQKVIYSHHFHLIELVEGHPPPNN